MKESMRLYPPAWGVGRRAIHDYELDGYTIPARTNLFLLQWVTQRDPRFFPAPSASTPSVGATTQFAPAKFPASPTSPSAAAPESA